jgi:hypothetical protein
MYIIGLRRVLFAVCTVLLSWSGQAFGQAYCALRDPVRAIQEFFPDAPSYRSIVREVTEEHRKKIGKELPFNIHRNELGRHTLYAVFGEGRALRGFVHVRSERGRWGLSEFAWSLDGQLKVKGLRFQRTRGSARAFLESEQFISQVRGKSLDQLKTLFVRSDGTIKKDALKVPTQYRGEAETALRSLMKTMIVTRIVWDPVAFRLAKLTHTSK